MTRFPKPEPPADSPRPCVPLEHLDQLWFQVAGTLCNLECHHCFISCSPRNRTFGFLKLDDVLPVLEEAAALGVKEFYYTGGEPFLNRDMVPILEHTLQYGPATVLTNATVFRPAWLERLAQAEADSLYSLEFRVSLDGFSAETNDPIRGAGTFERTMRGVEQLVQAGFLPIITATRTWPLEQEQEVIEQFVQVLKRRGYTRPRLKILPTIHLGAETQRSRGYLPTERVTAEMLADYDLSRLLCHHCRIVTDRGVYVCPLLLETPEARLGDRLQQALGAFAVTHGACYTCYVHGAICSNASGG